MANLHASSSRNPNAGEIFNNFFQGWLSEERRLLSELTIASKSNNDMELLRPLVNRCLTHCEQYYEAKLNFYREDVVASFNPKGKNKLQMAYGWIGGWRPTLAIHLLYTIFHSIFHGRQDGIGASPSQMIAVNDLHIQILNEEREISQMRAQRQYSVVDSSMVDLSHAFVEVINDSDRVGNMDERVKSILGLKRVEMEELVRRADDLRLRTIRTLVQILNPLQSVNFFMDAAEMHLTHRDF